MRALDTVYTDLGERVPAVRDLITVPDWDPEPSPSLLDRDWLAGKVDDAMTRYAGSDRRTAATLWWYSASAAILAPFTASLLAFDRATDPSLHRLRIWLRPDGYFRATRAQRLLEPGVEAAGRSLGPAFGRTLELLAETGQASVRALWSITTDALATQLLRAGEELSCIDHASEVAVQVSAYAPQLPKPRFIDLDTIIGPWRFVRRGSCCLLYQAPGYEKCNSCPRRAVADRHAAMGAGGP
jgi:ferric iron reductase protein FhuF